MKLKLELFSLLEQLGLSKEDEGELQEELLDAEHFEGELEEGLLDIPLEEILMLLLL